MARITSKPNVCGGRPCIRDTRIEIAVMLDGLAEGMTEPEIIDRNPQLTKEDIHASLAYAADLAHESVWETGWISKSPICPTIPRLPAVVEPALGKRIHQGFHPPHRSRENRRLRCCRRPGARPGPMPANRGIESSTKKMHRNKAVFITPLIMRAYCSPPWPGPDTHPNAADSPSLESSGQLFSSGTRPTLPITPSAIIFSFYS